MRGIDLVTGYGDKQQLPAVVQIKEDAVHVRETSLLNLIIHWANTFRSICDQKSTDPMR